MFHQALKVLLPVVVVLSLTLGALAWSASNVAYASNQPSQAQATTQAWPTAGSADQTQSAPAVAPTATPTPAAVYGAGYAAPFYGMNYDRGNRFDQFGSNKFLFRRDRDGDHDSK